MSLTTTTINSLKSKDKDQFHADGNGLYLRVSVSGSKTFLYRSRQNGKARWVTLGSYPAMSLADARKRVVTLGSAPDKITVQTAYDEWVKHINKRYKSPLQITQRMGKHFTPAYGGKPVASVTRAQLSTLLTGIAETAPVQANRLLGDLKLFFNYSVERGWVDVSPAEAITRKTVGGTEASRDRVLTDKEIADLIRELRSDRFHLPTRYALALLLVTGQRSGEVRGLTKSELGFESGVWRLPPHRTKNNSTQVVTLPKRCFTLMNSAIKELGSAPFKGMEGQTLSRAVKRMGVTWTPHDLRRTMATRMADMGVAPHVVEKCLNHTMGGVMAVYNRAEYAVEKKAAWRLWVRYILRAKNSLR